MISCSTGVIFKRFPEYAVFGLLGVVVAQGQLAMASPPCSEVVTVQGETGNS